jgi:dihydrofolate reductase
VGNLVLKMSVSVDGFVCGPNGEIDWIFQTLDPEATGWVVGTLWQASLHLMGSRTYHDMASFWPTSTESIAAPMNRIPKAVHTRRGPLPAPSREPTTRALTDATGADTAGRPATAGAGAGTDGGWLSPTVLVGDLGDEVARQKREQDGTNLAHGGARFAQGLAQRGLIDEYRLLTHPVALGSGQALFAALPRPLALRLVSATPFTGGAVAHVYRPA